MPDILKSYFAALRSGPTLADKMAAANNRSSGFDYLRFGLAVLILFFHTFAFDQVPFSEFMVFGPGRVLRNILVPMFFGLGGFLVAASLDRCLSLVTFLGLRVLRIFPALWADVLFSALVLGPLVTTLPLSEYFSAHEFHNYFWNLIGEIRYPLPGVFKMNPRTAVNSQLWTVPWDLGGYCILALMTLVGVYRSRRLLFSLALLSQVAILAVYAVVVLVLHKTRGDYVLVVIPCFLIGVSFHCYRDVIRWNRTLFFTATLVVVTLMLISSHFLWILGIPILYITVYLGLLNPKRRWIITSGDYSYGIFLYHWQIMQAIWLLVPFARHWYWLLIFSLPIAFLFAVASWHLLEKRVLSLKGRLNALDSTFAERLPITIVRGTPKTEAWEASVLRAQRATS